MFGAGEARQTLPWKQVQNICYSVAVRVWRRAGPELSFGYEDLAQEALHGITQALPWNDDGVQVPDPSILFIIARRRMIDALRMWHLGRWRDGHAVGAKVQALPFSHVEARNAANSATVESQMAEQPADIFADRDLMMDLEAALGLLDPRDREVIYCIMAGWGFKRIGRHLGVSESRISQLADRARKVIAQALTPHSEVLGACQDEDADREYE